MKLLVSAVILFHLLNTSAIAQNSKFKEPVIAYLSDKPMDDFAVVDCWDDKGVFKDEICEFETESAELENVVRNKETVQLKLIPFNDQQKNESIQLFVAGLQFYNRWSPNNYNEHSSRTKIPIGAPGIVFKFDSWSQTLQIYSRFKVPATGEVKLVNPEESTSEITLKVDDHFNKKFPDSSIKVELFGESIGKIGSKSIKIKVPAGDYQFKFEHNLGTDLEHTFTEIVHVEKLSRKTVEVNTSKFKIPLKTFGHYRLDWDMEKSTIQECQRNKLDSNCHGIQSLQSFKIVETGEDVTSFFEVQKGRLINKNQAAFESLVKNLGIYTLRIKVKTGDYQKLQLQKKYDVFSRANLDSPVLGVIKAFATIAGGRIYYSDPKKKVMERYISPLGSKKLKANLLQSFGEENGLVNLGGGPWGKVGWALIPYASFFSGRALYFDTDFKDTFGQFLKNTKNQLVLRTGSSVNFSFQNELLGTETPAEISELVDKSGRLKLKLIGLGPDLVPLKTFPHLVDLTDDKLGLNKKEIQTKVKLFSSPEESSRLLGEIQYDYLNDSLTGRYIGSSNMKKSHRFESDYFQGRCGDVFPVVAFQNLREIRNDFSLIGSGPWGNEAWVKAKRYKISDPGIPIKFSQSHLQLVSLESRFNSRNNANKNIDSEMNRVYQVGELKISPLCKESTFNGKFEQDPLYINLIPEDFKKPTADLECKPSAHTDSNELCHITQGPCTLLWANPNSSLHTLNVNFDKYVGGLNLSYNEFSPETYAKQQSSGSSSYQFENVRQPSIVTLVSVKQPDGLSRAIIPGVPLNMAEVRAPEVSIYRPIFNKNTSSIDLKYQTEFHGVNFNLETSSDKDGASIEIFGAQVGYFRRNSPAHLKMAPGIYPLKVTLMNGIRGPTRISFINLEIKSNTASTSQIQNLKFVESDFKPRSDQIPLFISIDNQYGHISISKADGVSRRITSISKFTLDGKTRQDMSKYTLFEKGIPKVKPNLLREFTSVINEWGNSQLKLEATCLSAELLPRERNLAIYSEPSELSKKLGSFNFKFIADSSHGNIKVSFVDQQEKISGFTPNLYGGYCEKFEKSHLYMQQIVSSTGEWSNLGRGPWGEYGWVKRTAQPIFSSRLKFDLHNDDSSVGFSKNADGTIKAESEFSDHDVINFKRETIISPSGRFDYPISCEPI